ncbi:cytochrome c [Dyadobacter chenwenxiniae]|uniref:Cytochrome c n=1 Tax=Dyadobacter chenwenxiniae TaxID=2906456 RepID=A0A9X1PNW2_9BACT|nr:cytochrome c [Dyadobacter chenwenxiniae]MCF0063739.1 cytochrome c [Dyadobacter chenwenxiniae]UON83414.1 cytochrome c [Dyadobacter chenwenxiniae]
MKKRWKVTGRALLVLSLIVGVFLIYIQFSYRQKYDVPQTGIVASRDSAVIARGEYLVMGVGHCWNCHAPDGETNLQTGSRIGMSGGLPFKLPFGTVYSANITSDTLTGIGGYSDEMLARTLRYSVRHDNTALIPFMAYNGMSDADIRAVISYLRTIKPIRNQVPKTHLNMAGKIVARFVLKPVVADPPAPKAITRDTSIAYGKYLATAVGNCVSCHTNRDKNTGAFVGSKFAGGYQMKSKTGVFVTPNLTPDPKTGVIASWKPSDFVRRFRAGAVRPHTPMPWKSFQSLSENDLKALYYFLHSLEPVNNNQVNP